MAWNNAQLWNLRNNPTATLYNFVETDDGTATSIVSFSMPAAYASIAVGWTTYKFAPGSRTSIVSTQTYLTPTVFSDAQGNNATARRYAFWLALHELGRILGLDSILDEKDIMKPRYTLQRITSTNNLDPRPLRTTSISPRNRPNLRNITQRSPRPIYCGHNLPPVVLTKASLPAGAKER